MKLKKMTVIFLAMVLIVALFAGCKKAAETETTEPKETAEANTVKPEAEATEEPAGWQYTMGGPVSEEEVEISVLTHSGWSASIPPINTGLPIFEEAAKRLGVVFDWQVIEAETYSETVNVRLMSTDLPDMVVLTDMTIATQLTDDDFFYSYDDLGYEENAPYANMLFEKDDYASFETTYRSIYGNGDIYAFGNTVVPRFLFTNSMVNVKWLDNLSMNEPSTIDEWLDMLRAFKAEDANGNGDAGDEVPIASTNEINVPLGDALSIDFNFGWAINEKGEITYEYVTNRYKDHLEIRRILYDEDLIDKENRDLAAYYELIASDRLGSISFYGTFQRVLSTKAPSYNPDAPIVEPVFREIIPLDNKYTGEKTKYSRLTNGTGEGMYILKSGKYPEVCLRIADWFWASDEYELLNNFGIEGKSFEYDENGNIVKIKPDDYDGTAAQYLPSIGGVQPPFAHRQSELAWRVSYGANAPWMIERADIIKEYYVDGIQPFVFTAEENEKINMYLTDVETYRDEMAANFIEGRASLDEYDAYVEQINKIGLEQITAIYQAKYDSIYK